MAKTSYQPVKFLWATTLFFLCLLVVIFLIFVYTTQNFGADKSVSPTLESVSPLADTTPIPNFESDDKVYQSKYSWKVSYPSESTLDTSLEKSELERVTISQSADLSAPTLSGYSVDFSVESKTTTLSTFADKDSLKTGNGTREYFAVATLAQKTGYKVKIVGQQEFISYYLPLRDESKVLVVTTTVAGPNTFENQKKVDHILETLELLD